MTALALSEFCTASLSSAIAGEGEAFVASFGPGAGTAAFCVCAPVCEQAEHTNTRIVKNSFIRLGMEHAIRIVAFSVDFRLRAIDAPLNRWMQEDRGKQAGELIFWSGSDLADRMDKTPRR